MVLTPSDWHKRYSVQAGWTHQLRKYLYERASIHTATRILDVGCGTGVLEAELASTVEAQVYALDIDLNILSFAKNHQDNEVYISGDAFQLPFATHIFDATICHFLLMWLSVPVQALHEMVRVTQPGGSILLLAEPDYGGRIDYPPELEQIGKWQIQSLAAQGANPYIGRRLPGLLFKAGLRDIEYGVLGGQWSGPPSEADIQSELDILDSDLLHITDDHQLLQDLREVEAHAWQAGSRILYVPTFYAWGRVMGNLPNKN